MKRTTIVIIILAAILILCAFLSYNKIDNFSVDTGEATVLFLNPPDGTNSSGQVYVKKEITCPDGEDAMLTPCSLTFTRNTE
jgi:hypothetical protein